MRKRKIKLGKEEDFELVCTPTGEIRIARYNKNTNKQITYLLEEMNVKDIEKINKFLNGSASLILLGQEWCG